VSYRKFLTIQLGILLLAFSAILMATRMTSATIGALGVLAGLAALGVAARMR
jgi:hypothetical protein